MTGTMSDAPPRDSGEIDHWNIVVYDHNGCERETIHDVNTTQKDKLMQIFLREDMQAEANPYDADGKIVNQNESVNYGVGKEWSEADE